MPTLLLCCHSPSFFDVTARRQYGNVQDPSTDPPSGAVIPLNDAAALFAALAESIRGAAVDWSVEAVERLELGLEDRYGDMLGDELAVKRLIVLARQADAA